MGFWPDSAQVVELRGKVAELTATLAVQDRELARLNAGLAKVIAERDEAREDLRTALEQVLTPVAPPEPQNTTAADQLATAVATGQFSMSRLTRIRNLAMAEYNRKQKEAAEAERSATREGFLS
jgi:uncharacterized coiled-coil protein SlyX